MKAKLPEAITMASYYEHIEYMDVVILLTLHNLFGFGAARLKRFYEAIRGTYMYYNRYNTRKEVKFGAKDKDGKGRMDIYMAKEDLKAIGFDYDKVVWEIREKVKKDG